MNDFSVNRAFLLPVISDEKKLDADLKTCLDEEWKQHFNTRDYSGDWSVIALRSQSGNAQDIVAHNSEAPFANTALMEKCSYFREIVDAFQFEKESVRLLRLKPGSVIHEHRDMGLAYRFDCFRLHIPVLTDAAVSFLVGGADIPMQKGECWYADFDLAHSVKNDSAQERIHLVIDGKRNAWTDELFGNAGYDFEAEKKQLQPDYDEATLNNMIEGLSKINTETAQKMVLDLEEKKRALAERKKKRVLAEELKGYIPSKIIVGENGIKFRWTYVGKKRFTESFFSDTLSACKVFPENSHSFSPVETSLEEFFEAAETVDAIEPSAFIFHVSRCGSTLLSQCLATSERCIVLAEVPLLDEILRFPISNPALMNEELSDRLFKTTVRFLARRSNGNETHLFIKCDSWHTLFYERIRRCFPHPPFVLLYRSPVEVERSHRKEPGMHTHPGVIEPSIFGLNSALPEEITKDAYFGKVLESYFNTYETILKNDPNVFPISYHDGIQAMLECVMAASGFIADEKMRNEIKERSRFHSKHPKQLFSEEKVEEEETSFLKEACEIFRRLEKKAGGLQ